MAGKSFSLRSRNRRRALVLAAALPVLMLQAPGTALADLTACQPTALNFAGLAHGALLGEQYAAQGIHLSALANEDRPNQLIVFDSNRTGTPDPDLQAGIGNLSVIPENITDENGDGLVDRPSDSIRGGKQIFTFDHERTVGSFTIVDIDHGHPSSHHATAYDALGQVIVKVPIVIGVDGNVQTVVVNAEGVRRLEITYRDSAGVTDLVLGCAPGGEGCTPGYWKQPQHFDSWPSPYGPNHLFATYFENAFPGKTLLEVLSQGAGGRDALGRHTAAALLNSASGGVDYAFTSSQVIAAFNDVFPGTDPSYEELKNRLEAENERGCDLD